MEFNLPRTVGLARSSTALTAWCSAIRLDRRHRVPHNRRPFTLQPGRNVLSVTAPIPAGTVESTPIETVVHVQADERQPALYGLAIGVTNYRDSALKAALCRPGRHGAGRPCGAREPALHLGVVGAPAGRDATRERIDAAFRTRSHRPGTRRVCRSISLATARPGAEYHFLPADSSMPIARPCARKLRQDQLRAMARHDQGTKSSVILDTCHAGTFVTAAAGETKALLGTRNQAEGRYRPFDARSGRAHHRFSSNASCPGGR